MAAPVCAASDKIDIVSTTSVLWDPIQYIGGDKVNTIDISPLMMNGSDIGMHSCTIKDIGKYEPYGVMFEDGKTPLSWIYEKKEA
jgi:ABC-type Zn uptake system ZnuABC Zn-binding protein ZnuA